MFLQTIPRCTEVRVEGGELLTEESEVKANWAGYFEWLYQSDTLAVEGGCHGCNYPDC